MYKVTPPLQVIIIGGKNNLSLRRNDPALAIFSYTPSPPFVIPSDHPTPTSPSRLPPLLFFSLRISPWHIGASFRHSRSVINVSCITNVLQYTAFSTNLQNRILFTEFPSLLLAFLHPLYVFRSSSSSSSSSCSSEHVFSHSFFFRPSLSFSFFDIYPVPSLPISILIFIVLFLLYSNHLFLHYFLIHFLCGIFYASLLLFFLLLLLS